MNSPLARVNVRADAWDLIWSFVHRTLVINFGLAVAGLPLMLALAAVAEPWRYPIFFGLLSLPVGPAAAAACGYLADDDHRPSMRVLIGALRTSARRSVVVSAVALALAGVLATDIRILASSLPGAVAVPLLGMVLLLVPAVSLVALSLTATQPDLTHRALMRIAVYAAVRSFPLSLLSLAVLVASAAIVSQVPLAGLATVPGCALWVVFTNTKLQLSRVLPEESQ